MKKSKTVLILIGIILILILCLGFYLENKLKNANIRGPVFAGSWYPSNKNELDKSIGTYLNNSKKIEIEGEIKALIVPHAGYDYSGQIAAFAFKQINENYKNIFLIGPSHKYVLTGISISSYDYFKTPLGKVKVSKKAEKMIDGEFIKNIEEAHSNEHSLEIEIPFLQKQIERFEIVPIIVGETDPEKFKNALNENLEEDDLIVVSADLSHYHEYAKAIELDSYSIKNILELNDKEILTSEIDASWAVASLLKLAKEKSWKPYLISYANSGDITGDNTSVVGYASIIFVEEAFNRTEKDFLLELARESVETYLNRGKKIEINEKNVPERLREKKACFVTFTKNNELRGCIGHILPQIPLYKCVIENSINAAVNDERFQAVRANEMKDIKIEISILSLPNLLAHENFSELLEKLKPYEHGVILKREEQQSTYLPIVWEQIPEKEVFLSSLCIKGKMESECWKDNQTEVYTYSANAFKED